MTDVRDFTTIVCRYYSSNITWASGDGGSGWFPERLFPHRRFGTYSDWAHASCRTCLPLHARVSSNTLQP